MNRLPHLLILALAGGLPAFELANPGFETVDADGRPTGWTAYAWDRARNGLSLHTAGEAAEGSRCLRLEAATEGALGAVSSLVTLDDEPVALRVRLRLRPDTGYVGNRPWLFLSCHRDGRFLGTAGIPVPDLTGGTWNLIDALIPAEKLVVGTTLACVRSSTQAAAMSTPDQRHQAILDLLAAGGYVAVTNLAERLQVSEMTIRRDLDHLERAGRIRRIQGGAVHQQSTQFSIDFTARRQIQGQAKSRIAAAAVRLIRPGQVVFLDSGTTLMAMAEFLATRSDLTIVTPSLPLAGALASVAALRVILLGGQLRADLLSTVGPLAEQGLAAFHFDISFLGTTAFDPQRGLSHSAIEEIPLRQQAAERADQVILLAGREKIGSGSGMFYLQPSAIDLVIRDALDPAAEAEICRITPNGLEAIPDPGPLPGQSPVQA